MELGTALLFLVGLGLLVLGAESLVRGASRLAASVVLSPLVIGLTVAAFGTGACASRLTRRAPVAPALDHSQPPGTSGVMLRKIAARIAIRLQAAAPARRAWVSTTKNGERCVHKAMTTITVGERFVEHA